VTVYQVVSFMSTSAPIFAFRYNASGANFDAPTGFTGAVTYTGLVDGQANYTFTPPPGWTSVDVLVVAGGGGGGSGGGGAGGLIYSSMDNVQNTSMSIVVGSGGIGGGGGASGLGSSSGTPTNGKNSSLGTLIAVGGGAGGGYNNAVNGNNGGSGGGTRFDVTGLAASTGTQNQGYPGGLCIRAGYGGGGGGGGAGGIGQNSINESAVVGRGGLAGSGIYMPKFSTVYGSPIGWFAGGGGGGANTNSIPATGGGLGGSGGGGNGSLADYAVGNAAVQHTGGGGGGGDPEGAGANGGSGIVIVRFRSGLAFPSAGSLTFSGIRSLLRGAASSGVVSYSQQAQTKLYRGRTGGAVFAFRYNTAGADFDAPTGFTGVVTYMGTANGLANYTWVPPLNCVVVDVLIVAGGGGVPGDVGGGGGAGGVRLLKSQTITQTTYTISVGAGGTGSLPGGANNALSTNGFNSSISTLGTSIGGGRGGLYSSHNAGTGGSGGGASYIALAGTGTAGQGFDGGSVQLPYVNHGSASGGGAGETGKIYGTNGTSVGPAGGNGVFIDIFPTYGDPSNLGWFGGGGGGGGAGGGGSGGMGGGGNGKDRDTVSRGFNGVSHTGGGGGGNGHPHYGGADGGSGIVIIRPVTFTANEPISRNSFLNRLFMPAIGNLWSLGALDFINSIPVAAYSLCRLFTTYTGPQVRVRRSGDSLETDVYLNASGIIYKIGATGTDWATWSASQTVHVSIWYDQSGKNKHATQATASLQPLFSSSAAGLDFNTNRYMALPNATFPTGNSSYSISVRYSNYVSGFSALFSSGSPGTYSAVLAGAVMSTTTNRHYWWGNDIDTTLSGTSNKLAWIYGQSTNGLVGDLKSFVNGVRQSVTYSGTSSGQPRNSTSSGNYIGYETLNGYANCSIHYLIVFDNKIEESAVADMEYFI